MHPTQKRTTISTRSTAPAQDDFIRICNFWNVKKDDDLTAGTLTSSPGVTTRVNPQGSAGTFFESEKNDAQSPRHAIMYSFGPALRKEVLLVSLPQLSMIPRQVLLLQVKESLRVMGKAGVWQVKPENLPDPSVPSGRSGEAS